MRCGSWDCGGRDGRHGRLGSCCSATESSVDEEGGCAVMHNGGPPWMHALNCLKGYICICIIFGNYDLYIYI